MAIEDKTYAALLDRARTAIAIDASAAGGEHVQSRLERLASTLLLEWVVGEKRFESQSQQAEYWLSRFYEEIFDDEQPDATRIYERFGVSLPRAAYLARLLRARRVAQWRQAASTEVKTQLERYKAGRRGKKGRPGPRDGIRPQSLGRRGRRASGAV